MKLFKNGMKLIINAELITHSILQSINQSTTSIHTHQVTSGQNYDLKRPIFDLK